MYGHVEENDETTGRPFSGRHRGRTMLPAPLALGLTVTALLTAFGVGAAVLPDSVTGSGVAAESAPRAELAADLPAGPGNAAGGNPLADPAADPATGPAAGAATGPSAPAPAAAPSSAAPSSAAAPKAKKVTPAKPRPTRPASKPKPKPKPKPPSYPPANTFPEMEAEVVARTNEKRRAAGCGNLRSDGKLRTAMRLHVQELARHDGMYISHVSDDGRTFDQRAREQGYTAPGGENVARGQRDAEDVVNSWMNSQGHRENMLNCDFKAIGVGVAEGDGSKVWGQIFGRS